MRDKKLRKYLIVSLGALSSLSSNGVIMASTEYLQPQVMNTYTNPQYMNQMPSYIPPSAQFEKYQQLPNNQIQTPVSYNNAMATSTQNSSEKGKVQNISLPAKIINNKPTKTPSGLPPASIARIQPTPSSNGFGFGAALGFMVIGGGIGIGTVYAWNTIMSKPNWEDSIIWQRVCRAHNYHNNFEYLNGDLIIETPDDIKELLLGSNNYSINNFMSNSQAALSLFDTIKKLYNEILNADGFKKLNFDEDATLELSKENNRKKAALESAINHLADPLSEYLKAFGKNDVTWHYRKEAISNDMAGGEHEISGEIPDSNGNNFKYSAIINKDGNNIRLESFTEDEE